MKSPRHKAATPSSQARTLAQLRQRLDMAEETLMAIRSGHVDAVVVSGKRGDQVFTLEGAEHSYRILIESMNEGAVTLTGDKTILYANQCFAGMVASPLEEVIGSSFRRFLSAEDRAVLKPLIAHAGKAGAKVQLTLNARDGSQVPVQVSIRALARNGSDKATVGLVVTDMTEARRTETLLRKLTHRVVQVQEAERSRVALDLHDNITQPLCAVHIHSQVLVGSLASRGGSLKAKAVQLREMLGETARAVQRISNNLTPHVLNELGLVAVVREARKEFADRTGMQVALAQTPLKTVLSAETELALFRILQEALRNVESHSRASHVTLGLGERGPHVRLSIHDDGIGFDQARVGTRKEGGFGLHSMRERASYVGGSLKIKSARRKGTEVEVLVPVAA